MAEDKEGGSWHNNESENERVRGDEWNNNKR